MQKLRLLLQITAILLLARLVMGWGDSNFEKWCPFGGIETTYLFFFHDTFTCSLGSSNLYVASFVLGLTLFTRRSFCSYVCPVGAIGEWSGKLRDRVSRKGRYRVPPRVDAVLRKIKYPLLVALLYFTFAEKELIFRMFDPFYALCSRHGEDITYLAYVTLGGIVVGSFLISMPFCRYLCPFAAVLNPFSRFGLLRITRDPANCLSCKMCDKVCEAGIPVSQVEQVTHARCTQCGECLSVCPKGEALYIGLPGQNPGADAAKASEQAAAQTAEGGK